MYKVLEKNNLYSVWKEEDRLKVLQIKIIPKTSTNNLNSYNLIVVKANFVICISIEVNLIKNLVQVNYIFGYLIKMNLKCLFDLLH